MIEVQNSARIFSTLKDTVFEMITTDFLNKWASLLGDNLLPIGYNTLSGTTDAPAARN